MKLKISMVLVCVASLAFGCSDPEADVTSPDPAVDDDAGQMAQEDTASPDMDVAQAPDATPEDEPVEEVEPLDFAAIGPVTLIQGGFGFTEGPEWDEAGQRLLFSDIDGDTIHTLTLPDTVGVFLSPSGRSNGLTFDHEGRLLIAGHTSRNVARANADAEVEILVSDFDGQRFNAPNDIAARDDGTIYFTDPAIGLTEDLDRDLDFEGLFRIDPEGALHLEAPLEDTPNGVVLSPDQKTLYVTMIFIRELRAYDVAEDGALSNPRSLGEPAFGDGMTVDRAGNIYVAAATGVVVYGPDGTEHGTIPVPETAANCTFGGESGDILFITAREGLYQVADMPIPGF